MKAETVNRILQTIDAEMQRIGGAKNWDDAMEVAKEYFNAPDGILPFAVGQANRLVSRAELEKRYSAKPEPTRGELEGEIKRIKKLGGSLRKAFVQAAKGLPHDPGGRRSLRGNPEEQKRRVQDVASLIAKGLKTTDAMKRVARKHGVSPSSMWRTWEMRKQSTENEDID